MLVQRKLLAFVAPSCEKYLFFAFQKCVNELLFHLPKTIKIISNVFHYDEKNCIGPVSFGQPGKW